MDPYILFGTIRRKNHSSNSNKYENIEMKLILKKKKLNHFYFQNFSVSAIDGDIQINAPIQYKIKCFDGKLKLILVLSLF